MAGKGPPPKEGPKHGHRAAADQAVTSIPAEAKPLAAPLLPDASQYDHRTRGWYSRWASSPQATRFLMTDWQRLHMLAPLVDKFWRNPDRGLLAEIRLNEASLGATVVDRQRLRWQITPTPPPESKLEKLREAEARQRERVERGYR